MKQAVAPGKMLQDRYVIECKLDAGNMGAIYKAKDQHLNGATVAIKQKFAEAEDLELREQFKREANILAKLSHPALPLVTNHFFEDSDQFLVMQFIDGVDLKNLSERRSDLLTFAEVANWADTLLDALDYMHRQKPPVIHRDIKPANIKLTSEGRIFLLDFGLAKNASSTSSHRKSLHGFTRAYASPEQIQDKKTDARSDLFSLGATLYHLLTGQKPKDAEVRTEVIKHGRDPLAEAHFLNPQLLPAISKVLMRAMCLEPQARYQNASEMMQAWKDIGLYESRPKEQVRNLESQGQPLLSPFPLLIANGKSQKIVVALNAPDDKAKPQPEIAPLQQTGNTAFENQPKLPQQKNDPLIIKPEMITFASEVTPLRNSVLTVFSQMRPLKNVICQHLQQVYVYLKWLVSTNSYYSAKSNRIEESRTDPHLLRTRNEKKKAVRPQHNIEEEDEVYAVRPRRRRRRPTRSSNSYFAEITAFVIVVIIIIGLSASLYPKTFSRRKAQLEQLLKDWRSYESNRLNPTPAPLKSPTPNTSPRREVLNYALELFKSENSSSGQLVNGANSVTGEQVFRFRFTPQAIGWFYLLGRDLQRRPLMLSIQQVSDKKETIHSQRLRLKQSSTANFTVILAPKEVAFLQGLGGGQNLSEEQESAVSKLREQYQSKTPLLEPSLDRNSTRVSAMANKNDLVIFDLVVKRKQATATNNK